MNLFTISFVDAILELCKAASLLVATSLNLSNRSLSSPTWRRLDPSAAREARAPEVPRVGRE